MAQPSTSGGAIKRPCSNLKLVYNRPKPDVLNSILKSRANPRYRSRRLWYELNMPECTSTIFDGKMLSSSLPDSLLCHTREMRTKNKQKARKKERLRTYMDMRMERENFRLKLVELIACDDGDVEMVDEDGVEKFPNKKEKQMLRYYYYIKHGIDTIHVASMSGHVLNRIKKLIRPELNKWQTEFNETISEIKGDYTFAMKKAVIDFVLNNSLQALRKDKEQLLTPERKDIKVMMNRWRYRMHQAQVNSGNCLFKANDNPVIERIVKSVTSQIQIAVTRKVNKLKMKAAIKIVLTVVVTMLLYSLPVLALQRKVLLSDGK